MNSRLKLLFPVILVLVFWTSCKKDEIEEPITVDATSSVAKLSNQVIWEWNELYLQLDKDALGFRPCPGPRALAYMGLAAYEIAVPGMPTFKSLGKHWGPSLQIPAFGEPKEIYWDIALNESYAILMKNFFNKSNFVAGFGHLDNPSAKKLIDNLKLGLSDKFESGKNANTVKESKTWGEKVANAIWEWSKTDTYGHEADLNPLNNDPAKELYYNWKSKSQLNGKTIAGKWYPTNDNPDGGMFPFGGLMRTFATNDNQKLCPPPLAYSEDKNSPYYVQALEVYSLSNPNMRYEDRWISEFWSDDIFGQTFSPPSRVLAILDQVMRKENSNLEKAVESVSKLGLGLNDFAVSCWYSKYVYNIERPENFIKRLMDPNWEPILTNTINGQKGITPAFPAYPSGHSTFGGGAGVVLADLFGQNYEFADNCHKSRVEFIGTPRTFGSFEDAGYENAFSRVTLGVHFRMDCAAGVALGQGVARRVLQLPWKN